MPDGSVLEASRTLIDFGVVGAMFVLTLAALIFCVKQWIERTRELNAEKDKRLDDAKFYMAESSANREAMTGVKQALDSNTTVMQTTLSLLRRGV